MKRLALVALVAGLLAGGPATATATAQDGRRTYTGTIDGAEYRVEMPDRWNGTLVLFSHGYYPEGFRLSPIALANRPETETWLLEHGYALAASEFQGQGAGYVIEPALRDNLALLDWFEAKVGRPDHTIAHGQSLGAAIAVLLAERNPHRFDGVATVCGEYDPNGTWNMGLDITFAIRTLLAPGQDIDLVRLRDPATSVRALTEAVERALTTEEGQARLALANAFGNIPGWYSAFEPMPTDPIEWIRQQAAWDLGAYIFGMAGRVDLERRAGGNPSWNVGIDYRRQLARSSQTRLVREAYRRARLDLRADLEALAAAPRIAPDPQAVRYMYRYGVVRGTTPVPVVTLHNTLDGGAVSDQERWYAEQVRRHGEPSRLRQLYVHRGMHCAFSAAEEIVTLRALLERIETGRWPDLRPDDLNAQAAALPAPYHRVLDFGSGETRDAPPAFARFRPARFLRPSR